MSHSGRMKKGAEALGEVNSTGDRETKICSTYLVACLQGHATLLNAGSKEEGHVFCASLWGWICAWPQASCGWPLINPLNSAASVSEARLELSTESLPSH